MKTKLILIALFTILFSPFTQADIVPQKVIAVSNITAVERFYNHNKNYRTVYTKKTFAHAVCLLNPEHFKTCSDYEFRHMAKKIWYFPALPEAKNTKTIKQIYGENEVYRVLFQSFTKFQQEVCKNNPEKFNDCTAKTLNTITKSVGLKTTSRPLTYLIHGETNNSVVFEEKTFTKTKNGYYILTQISVTTENKAGEIKTQKTVAGVTLLQALYRTTPKNNTLWITNTDILQTQSGIHPSAFLHWHTVHKKQHRRLVHFKTHEKARSMRVFIFIYVIIFLSTPYKHVMNIRI
jgi:hypothetical protein